MTSHRIEKSHVSELNRLLLESGLTCDRPASESEEASIESEESVKKVHITEAESVSTETIPEEGTPTAVEEIEEELPKVFPTPSLRRVLPDKIRSIEQENRIHVLPESFRTDIDPLKIPKIVSTPLQDYINVLAEMTGCKSYKSSLAEYWFLDTLANLLRRAQEDRLDKAAQVILIRWYCEWMKEMQQFDAANRKRMLKRFKENMLAAAGYVAREGTLPTPSEIGVSYLAEEAVTNLQSVPADSRRDVSIEGRTFQCSLRDLTRIIHYIYDLFSTDLQYDLVRSVFTFSPEYSQIHAPHQFNTPKKLYVPLNGRPKTAKKESKVLKGKKKEVENEEYLHLLQLQIDLEREQEEQEEKSREDWNRRSHLLPLAFAVEDSFFDKYWPPPSVEQPVEQEIDTKGKGKNKKK